MPILAVSPGFPLGSGSLNRQNCRVSQHYFLGELLGVMVKAALVFIHWFPDPILLQGFLNFRYLRRHHTHLRFLFIGKWFIAARHGRCSKHQSLRDSHEQLPRALVSTQLQSESRWSHQELCEKTLPLGKLNRRLPPFGGFMHPWPNLLSVGREGTQGRGVCSDFKQHIINPTVLILDKSPKTDMQVSTETKTELFQSSYKWSLSTIFAYWPYTTTKYLLT
jgi:hypothetical protein